MGTVSRRYLCSRPFSDNQALLLLVTAAQIIVFELCFSFERSLSVLSLAGLIWRYTLLALLLYEVWQVTSNEPTDPVLSGTLSPEEVEPEQMLYCVLCDQLVLKTSRHCFRCGRCAHEFDHHCKYLNVCVGGTNYVYFLRLLATFILYNCLLIVMTLLQEDSAVKYGYLLVAIVLAGLVLALLAFHYYINHWLGVTTLEYLIPRPALQVVD